MNMNIILGLETLSKAILLIAEGMKEDLMTKATSLSVQDDSSCPVNESKTDSVEVGAAVDSSTKDASETRTSYSEEELGSMSYNDIKKLAKELGISAVGNRKELVKKILSSGNETADVEEVEESKVSEPVKTDKSTKSFNSVKAVEPEPVPDDSDEDYDYEDEEESDPVESKVLEATEGMSDDEIRELLEDVGVSSKGKRQALISKLVKAVNDGLIDLDSEDEEDEDSNTQEEKVDVTEGMTKARRKAYEELCDETEEAFEKGEISRDDIIGFINAYNDSNEKFKGVSDEDLLEKYLILSATLVDDEGNVVEEGAYIINDEPYCCGHPLHYDEDSEKFVCEYCGSEYEVEE